jgi:hypothetical protein
MLAFASGLSQISPPKTACHVVRSTGPPSTPAWQNAVTWPRLSGGGSRSGTGSGVVPINEPSGPRRGGRPWWPRLNAAYRRPMKSQEAFGRLPAMLEQGGR